MDLSKKKTVHFLPLDVENMIKLGQRAKVDDKRKKKYEREKSTRSFAN